MSKKVFIPNDLVGFIQLRNGKKLYITSHSQNRLKNRKIEEKYIDETFCNPDVIMPNKDFENARNYEKTIDSKRIKIGVKDDAEPFVLITAFIRD
jgi:hypothetical protein